MLVCARCGRENPEDARFCSVCGAELAAPTGGVVEERKIVTVLFADVTGSTTLGERLDAEALKEVMGSFFEAMRAEIEAEGGTVEKFIGDAIMAAFGVPRVHEDDPARAMRAALRMHARLRTLNGELQQRHGVALELRIGINTGEVLAAVDPRPGEAMATGDAVNAAARLEQNAQPGQILVSERTALAARGFHFGEPQSLELRGKSQPLRALELHAEQPVAEGALSGASVPLVGRLRELDLLITTYQSVVAQGRPQLVTVYGEAGVGKSRLVGELLASLEAAAPTPLVVRGRCLAYGEGITFWALAELVKSWANVLDSASAEAAYARVVEAVQSTLEAARVPDASGLARVLAVSIGFEGGDEAPRSAHELRAETQLAWRSFFSALAAPAPAIVLVEDLHWADPALFELLEDVADRAVGPLLFLCTARPELTERRPTWGGGRRSFTSLAVAPLSPQESAQLADLLFAADAGSAERDAILARAEGNPFFLEEIIRARRSAPGAAEIPDTVQGALAARIDLLPAEEKTVLQAAAVVGRVFWPAVLAEVTSQESAPIDVLLDGLQDRDLVLGRLSSTMDGQRELIFKHALIRDVAYESLPRRDRVRIHAGVADWIEETFAERRGEIVELVGHHRAAAHKLAPSEDRRAAAFAAVVAAAESALRRSAYERALALGTQALELASRPLERARALEVVGLSAFPNFDGTLSWEALSEAADILVEHAPGERMRLATICGFAVMVPTRAQGLMRSSPTAAEVRPYLELGLEWAGDEDSEALVLLLAAEGYWEFGLADELDEHAAKRGQEAARRGREIAKRLGRPDLEAMSLDALSSGLNVRGLYGLAGDIDADRLELARHMHDPFEVTDCFYTAAWAALEVGRYREVLALCVELEARDLAVPPIGLRALAALANLALGRWDEALEDQRHVVEGRDDVAGPPPSFASPGYGVEALIRQAREDPAARDQLEHLRRWADAEYPRRWPLPQAAIAFARLGEFQTAHELLAQLGDRDVFRPRRLEALCAVIAEQEAWDEAEGVIAAAREHAQRARLLVLPLHADRLEGRLLFAREDPAGAVDALTRAARGFASHDARWEVAQTELVLGEALLALGRTDEGGEALSRSAAVFEELGVVRELARAHSRIAARG